MTERHDNFRAAGDALSLTQWLLFFILHSTTFFVVGVFPFCVACARVLLYLLFGVLFDWTCVRVPIVLFDWARVRVLIVFFDWTRVVVLSIVRRKFVERSNDCGVVLLGVFWRLNQKTQVGVGRPTTPQYEIIRGESRG